MLETVIKTRPVRAAMSLQRLIGLGIPVAYRPDEEAVYSCGYHPGLARELTDTFQPGQFERPMVKKMLMHKRMLKKTRWQRTANA
jgi:hypothetical protein